MIIERRHAMQPKEMDHLALVCWRIVGGFLIGFLWVLALAVVA